MRATLRMAAPGNFCSSVLVSAPTSASLALAFAFAAGLAAAFGAGLEETVFLALLGFADGFLAGIRGTPGDSEGRGIIQTGRCR